MVGGAKDFGQGPPEATLAPPGHQGPQFVYTWKGTPYEIGYRHGRTLRDAIVREAGPAVEELARKRRTSAGKALEYLMAKYEPLYREYVPMALEEIRGIAHGSGLGYPYAFFAGTRDAMKISAAEDTACTAIACGKATTVGGKVFLGQNKDTDAAYDRYRIMRLAYDSGRRMILLNYPGWIANIGLTSDGVAFTGNALFGRSYPGETLPGSLFKRIILEKRSVREILAALPRLPLPLGNGCIMIGDSTGHLVCLEFVAGRVNIRDVSDQAFGHANSITCAEFKAFAPAKPVSRSSPVRQRNVQRELDAVSGRVTMTKVKRIFADHTDFPLSICHHRYQAGEVGTTASYLANLTDLEMDIAIGNPCVAPYRRYTFDF